MKPVVPRIVSDVSYATRIKHASRFAWQAKHLVRVEGETCCSAQKKNTFSYVTRIKHASHFVWQPQYLVRLESDTCCFA